MKKLLPIIITAFLLSACNSDPLWGIRRIARSEDLEKKKEAAQYYKRAVDTLIDAYASQAGLNKDIGRRLLYNKDPQYKNAIKHLTIAKETMNSDAEIYYMLGVAHANLFRIEQLPDDLFTAKGHYETALRLAPNGKDYLYAYSQLLVFGTQDYTAAIKVLEKYLYELNTPDHNGYFLLGRCHYMLDNDAKAYEIFNDALKYKDNMTKKELDALYDFIKKTGGIVNE